MGKGVVIATGVLSREGQRFITKYEVRRFKHERFVEWCDAQPGEPTPGEEEDIGDGTLRCMFTPDDYYDSKNPIHHFRTSRDITALEDPLTQREEFLFRHKRVSKDIGMVEWDHQRGTLFHLVLPPLYLPFLASIKPPPCYGWQTMSDDRFVIGWRYPLAEEFTLRFREVAPEVFAEQAEQLSREIDGIADCEPEYPGKVDPMSSTTFEPVFRVGASGHPVETLDTGAEGAGGAQQPRPRRKKVGVAHRPYRQYRSAGRR